MGSITLTSKGSFERSRKFLKKMGKLDVLITLNKYGRKGVEALASATPVDTGKTSESWDYKVEKQGDDYAITWYNTNVNKHTNIAIILQYGHGTGTGGYVAGRDYINPAIQPIFDEMADTIWKEVTSA